MEERVNGPAQMFVYNTITSIYLSGRLPDDHRRAFVALYGEPAHWPSELEVVSKLRTALAPYTKNLVFVDRPAKGDATISTTLHICDESFYAVVQTLGELYTSIPR